MQNYAHPPENPTPDPDTSAEQVELYGGFRTALGLWVAFREHGVMPYGGGYMQQPRKWRDTIEYLNERYFRAYHGEPSSEFDLDSFKWGNGSEPPSSFEDFMKRG